MRIGSLFTGYGGLDMAAQSVFGGAISWVSEIEPAACQVIDAHHPGTLNLGDITKVNWRHVPPVDILTGGYPCQPFSHAGQRKGKNDERHLWPYVAAAVDAIRPRFLILENVRGHLSLGFADVLADLAAVGMSAKWGVVRASDAGACHTRARLFIIAYPDNARWGEYRRPVADESQHVALKYPCDITADADGNGHGIELHTGGMAGVESRAEGAASERQWARGQSDAGSDHDAPDTDGTSGKTWGETRHDSQWVRDESLGLANDAADADGDRHQQTCRTAASQAGWSSASNSGRDRIPATVEWGKYGPAIRRWEHVIGRSAPDPTISGMSGRPRLSPIFVEWMMGLPEGHVTGHGLSAAKCLKMLGNGVVPQQAALALRMLVPA